MLPGVLILALLSGCAAGASGSRTGMDRLTGADGTAAEPAVTYEVASRELPLRDPGRATDPTPGSAGDDAAAGRDLPTTVWAPRTGEGPFPVVVFSHGLLSEPSAYEELLAGWAAAGLVVAAPAYPLTRLGSDGVFADVPNQPADVSFVLDEVLALGTTDGDPLAGRVDPSRVAVAGHSAGAITSLGLLSSCCRDERVTAAVVLAGSARVFDGDFADPGVPTLFVHGSRDDVLPLAEGTSVAAAAPGPTAFLELADADHSAPYDDAGSPWFATVAGATTAFLRWALADDAAALDELRAVGDGLATDELPR